MESSLQLLWQPPPFLERNGNIAKYIVHYEQISYVGERRNSLQLNEIVIVQSSSQEKSVTVTLRNGIFPASRYKVSLQACVDSINNTELCSMESTSENFTTDESSKCNIAISLLIQFCCVSSHLLPLPTFYQHMKKDCFSLYSLKQNSALD